ncbi:MULTISPECIES: restriction endonuclease subunit S [unclassified Nostoc]|uniref:restriction endonuclease subunit S n=1 Tax=unclassified Nostoc TaxID=2593658 RepID=UPI0026165A98|nr:restriction endonuclease subunit S [Nostoc sp. S13]MDF5737083.1 restriction endonuclease subunit S [Nostoc sp. S13]
MGKYKGYEKYKDSGVEWLGAIPEHWKAVRLKHITNQIIDGAHFTPTYVNEGIPFLRVTDIVQAKNNSINMNNIKFIPEEEHNTLSIRCKPEKGDLLYSKNGTIGVPRIVDWDFDFSIFVSLCLIKVIKPKVNIEFLQYSLLGKLTETQINIGAKSNTVTNLHLDKIKEFWATLPPLDEQKAIAHFLDYKTKQIDDLIAKKEALIEKLDEKRTAFISHAVTKGLDPSVPMKDSGVEWLGEIPKHWEVIKVKHLTKILRGKFTHRPRNDPRFYDGQYPFIQTGDVANANKFIMEYTQTLNDNGYAVSKEFPSGTLVMTIAANIGDMAILNFNACFPDSIVGFLPSKMTEIFFLYYLFSSMKKQFLSTAVLNTQLNLNVERISNLFTVILPLDEQIKITKFLDKELQNIDQQKAQIKKAIERLKEYRTALITNAVTGKIDVRQVPIP